MLPPAIGAMNLPSSVEVENQPMLSPLSFWNRSDTSAIATGMNTAVENP